MSQQTKKSYALPIAMMFALFAMIAFVTNLCSPMGVIVKNQFGASNFMASLGTAANFIAYAVMGIPAGLMLKKYGYKNTALTAIAVGFTGVLVQYLSGLSSVQSFWVYLLGAFISGFSMCMLNTVVNPMLNTLGGGGNKGNQLIQFGGTLNSFSATFVTILVGALIGDATKASISDATPALFIAMGIFAIVFIVLLCVNIPEPEKKVEKISAHDKHSAFSFRHFVLGIIAIFTYMGVEAGVPYYVNQYLTALPDADVAGFGMDAGAAGSIVGVFWLLMLVGRLIGGMIGEKVSSRVQITTVSSLCICLLLIGMFAPSDVTIQMPGFNGTSGSFQMVNVPIGILFFILTGLCTSVMWGGIFNMAVEGLGKYTAVASGMFMVMVCGGGIIPPLQGWIADVTNSYMVSYFVVIACSAYILFYALIGSKNVNKDIPTE